MASSRVRSWFAASVASAALVASFFVQPARAEQPRDWMVAAQPGGTHLNLDIVLPGLQAQLEHRIPIYGQVNEVTFKVNALPTLFFLESQADVDVRILVLTLGASIGVRQVFHAFEFQPDEAFDAHTRRDLEFAGDYGKSFATYGEGRVQLSLPFNDNVVFVSVNALRLEGGRDRAYDWRLGVVRDSGALFRSDTVLYIKHRKFGALGPRIQYLNYELAGVNNNQINFGFSFATRPGFRKRNDIVFVSALFGFGGTTNGVPTEDVYGNHLLGLPVTLELAYRTVFELWHPSKPGEIDHE